MCSVPHAPTSSVRCWLTEVENEIPPWEARCLKISRGVMMSTSSRSVISPEVKGHGAVRDSSICRSCDDSSALKSQVIVRRSLDVLNRASATGRSKPFRNLITDRDRAEPSDGTTNNYCDRYASSVQSAYNAAWLSHFARHCVDNAVFITAAPLGGRPSAEGLMELCVAPRGYFELHRRILALCQQPGNTKFLGIGSGLQRKFGEVTMARNDPAGTVPEPESRRFMAAVRRVKEELDPDGTGLDLHDTGTDMEIFPRVMGGRPSFDKAHTACDVRRTRHGFMHASPAPTVTNAHRPLSHRKVPVGLFCTGMEADPAGGRSQTCHALQIDISDASYDDKTGADSRLAPRTSAQALQDAKEAADARGSVRWWLRGTCGASGAATGEKAQNRDLQETCIFALVQADGRTRRLVRKMGSDDRDREVYQGPPDFDDTASWQSWRSLASHGSLRLSRSASEASCHSTTSGAAMQELLAGSDDHYFASIAAGRDWATCIFAEHRQPGDARRSRSGAFEVRQIHQRNPACGGPSCSSHRNDGHPEYWQGQSRVSPALQQQAVKRSVSCSRRHGTSSTSIPAGAEDQKLGLHMVEGPNIVCGDTGSDLPMVLAALRLMCGDKMVERWQERLRQEETEQTGEQEEEPGDDGEMDEAAKEEAERKAREEEEEEREARVSAGKLAVLFVASPESYSKSPKVADQVRKWCDLSGAHCALLPSPDVLVYTLAKFAEERSGSSVTTCHHGESVGEPDLERDWTLTSLPHRDSVTSLPELPEPSGGSPSLIPSKAYVRVLRMRQFRMPALDGHRVWQHVVSASPRA
eukprot:s7664_g4.t2